MKIGIFDSGIGGLTLLKEALKVLPGESFLYYADTDNVPYGTKERERVKQHVLEGVEYISNQGVKALVIACNTATSITIHHLRDMYTFPILGIEPAVKPAVKLSNGKRVLVFATPLELKEEMYTALVERIDTDHIVDSLALPGLVEFAEKFIFDRDIVIPYLLGMLKPFDLSLYGTVVLGCTHFPFFRHYFREIFGSDTEIIDGAPGTICHLYNILKKNEQLEISKKGEITFVCSGKKADDPLKFLHYLEMLD